MADTWFSPSEFKITRAAITTYDGSKTEDLSGNFITRFAIEQAMDKVSWSGSLSIADATGFMEKFPLRAEEKLDLWIRSFDFGETTKLMCRVHSITNIQPSDNSNMVTYDINFVSETSFNASLKKVTAPFRSSISGIAKAAFTLYFAPVGQGSALDPDDRSRTLALASQSFPLNTQEYDRQFFVQPTVGITKVIIPDLSPTEAMYFLAARGYNPDSPSQTFRFFETLENYYFCTDEYFLKGLRDNRIERFFYAPKADLTPENARSQVSRIESLSVISKGKNTSSEIYNGSYRNEIAEIDLVRRNFTIHKFNYDDTKYIDMNGKTRKEEDDPHTPEFKRDVFTQQNARRFMLFKTYQKPGDLPSSLHANKHLSEIVQNRVSYYHHLNGTVLAASMKGRMDLRPGQVIHIDIKNLDQAEDGKVEINQALGGRYLIQATNHSGEGNTLTTSLRLLKFDFSSGNEGTEDQQIPEVT